MKRKLVLMLFLSLLFSVNAYASDALANKIVPKNGVQVDVTNSNIIFKNESISCNTFIFNDTLYVPLRDCFEMLGHNVQYNSINMSVEISKQDLLNDGGVNSGTSSENTGAHTAYLNAIPVYNNGTEIGLDSYYYYDNYIIKSLNCNDKIFIPAKTISTQLGLTLNDSEQEYIKYYEVSGKLTDVTPSYGMPPKEKWTILENTAVESTIMDEAIAMWINSRYQKDIKTGCDTLIIEYETKVCIAVLSAEYVDEKTRYCNATIYEVADS